jgi:tRNA U34 5-methylaminomethyl-2-thiouridine-forming methyltransferase MnmC
MPPLRRTIAINHDRLVVQVTDDASRTLIDPAAQVAYHSASGAITETSHVYLNNSGVAERLSAGLSSSVLEVGLGTGMGLLLTLDLAAACKAPLRYTAIECDWLEADILEQLKLGVSLGDRSIAEKFLAWRRRIGKVVPDGRYQWNAGPDQQAVVHHTDALQWEADPHDVYDAVYLDPFAPAANPGLWRPPFLAKMYRLLREGGNLVTYCVNRQVRDDMTRVGFEVNRVPGPPGGKREVMKATKVADKA